MEYPTIFTSLGTSYLPPGIRLLEMVTIHEFGHGYWYGIVGSNEFEEAWLDEGINSYSGIKAMTEYYGAGESLVNIAGFRIGDLAYHRLSVIASGRFDPIVKKSWDFISGSSYSLNVYSKAGLMMLTLRKHPGRRPDGPCGRIMKPGSSAIRPRMISSGRPKLSAAGIWRGSSIRSCSPTSSIMRFRAWPPRESRARQKPQAPAEVAARPDFSRESEPHRVSSLVPERGRDRPDRRMDRPPEVEIVFADGARVSRNGTAGTVGSDTSTKKRFGWPGLGWIRRESIRWT